MKNYLTFLIAVIDSCSLLSIFVLISFLSRFVLKIGTKMTKAMIAFSLLTVATLELKNLILLSWSGQKFGFLTNLTALA